MSKNLKTQFKVQKQTSPNNINFQPKKVHKRKSNRQTDEGYIGSLKRILQNKLFHKNQPIQSFQQPTHKLSQQKRNKSAKKSTPSKSKSKSKTTNSSKQKPPNSNDSEQIPRRHTQSTLLSFKNDNNNETISLTTQNPRQIKNLTTILQSVYLKIKYVKKMSLESVLIGNQNQLDFIIFEIQNYQPFHEKKWSLSLDKPIDGVTTSVLAESKILLWAESELFIYECNPKNLSQLPHQIHKIRASQNILSVQFVKRNIFLIICRSHIQIYEMTEISRDLSIKRLEKKKFTSPKHFQVVEIPQLYENNVKIFFANMKEYEQPEEEKQKEKQGGMFSSGRKGKSKDVFGLYYVEIEYDYSGSRVYEMKKVYDIKKNLRQEIKLLNISTNIFFLSLKTEVLAVKNGLIIDSVGVNFKFENCYLKIIKNDVLVHILTDKIEFYHLRLNYQCLPQKIIVEPFDSIYFSRDLSDQFLSIVPINDGYAILFQNDLKKHQLRELKQGQIRYWYGLTYPILLKDKLNQIFPSSDKLAETSFEVLETLCDMAGKMGLSSSQAYRELWRKSRKQKQKEYQILLASKNYKIIQQQITTLLKHRAQKLRLISKNQQICLEFLRNRIYENSCTLQNLEEFSRCHFLNIKLNCYKHMEVQRRRFEMDVYRKGRETGVQQISKFMEIICRKEDKGEDFGEEIREEGEMQSPIRIQTHFQQLEFNMEDSEILDSEEEYQITQNAQYLQKDQLKIQPKINQKTYQSLQTPNLFATFLRTSKKYSQIEEDRKNFEVRERQKLRYQVENKMKQADYNQIKINIKDYYFFRDCNLKQLFLQTVSELMSKQHTFSDHLKYFNLRVLINSFKLCFRSIYEQILCLLICTYKHKITRLIEHYMQLLPFEFIKTPDMTDPFLCQSIWTPIQLHQLDECLFLNDIMTIENREVVEKFRGSLWFKRNELTHHGVILATKEEVKLKYSEQNMINIRDHYFYLFISKFLQIKISLNNQLKEIQTTITQTSPEANPIPLFAFLSNNHDKQPHKKTDQARAKVQKELLKTNQLLKRIQQVYPLIPSHLKGFIHLYFDLYNFLETIQFLDKPYNSVYEFLKLRDFQLFNIFFSIQKKIKGFIIKQILKKYQNPQLLQKGRQKFIEGIQHYFDSNLSQITDLKTILNRLNGQTCEFHIQFQGLYDCLLSAIMKKIRISPSSSVNLDELLIYVQNIPFSTGNGRIFEKLLLIQEVHLEMETLKRSGIDMSILEIKNSPEIVISALVEAELSSQLLVLDYPLQKNQTQQKPLFQSLSSIDMQKLSSQHHMLISSINQTVCSTNQIQIQSVDELKMYFYKCVSELLCIKRHFYGDEYEMLLGFIFVTELMEKPKLVPLIEEALQDDDIRELLSISAAENEQKFRKALVYYSYRRRLSKEPQSYLNSQVYIRSILKFLPKSDNQRLLIQHQLKYCQIFKKCEYNVPYPLSVKFQLPIMDQIEYHIRQISSDKIDQLDVAKLFNAIQTMRELIEPCLDITQRSLDERIKEFQKVLYEFVFFKYLRERKIHLALNMIDKLILLNPNDNCIIYPVFIIDVIIEQFNDTTSDLIIKLISYFYDSAQQLRDLLQELINIKLTTHQFQQYIQQKIQNKISSNSYQFLNPENYILSLQVQSFFQSSPNPKEKIHLCELFDTVFRHLQKSSQYIQKKRYYQIIYRIMLFNPYQAAQFIYSKQKNINIKALRGFFSFMSQEFLFSPQIVLKVGAYIFIIMLQRMRDNFLISQQIKEYSKLDLNFESIDEAAFESKFSDVTTLSPMEKLVYESYLAMKAKSETFISYQVYESIQKQLNRVKQLYDKDLFLIKKNNISSMEKHNQISYLKHSQWLSQPKLNYYLKNINQYASYTRFNYLYSSCDKDDQYVMKGVNQFTYPKVESWPEKVQFDKVKERRQILIEGKSTRILDGPERGHMLNSDSVSDKNNLLVPDCSSSKRKRKASSYLPEQFQLQRKQAVPHLHHLNSSSGHMQRSPSKSSFKDEEFSNNQIKRTQSYYQENSQQQIIEITSAFMPLREQGYNQAIKPENLPPKPTQKKLNQSKSPNIVPTSNSNPILNFFENGSFFMNK